MHVYRAVLPRALPISNKFRCANLGMGQFRDVEQGLRPIWQSHISPIVYNVHHLGYVHVPPPASRAKSYLLVAPCHSFSQS